MNQYKNIKFVRPLDSNAGVNEQNTSVIFTAQD